MITYHGIPLLLEDPQGSLSAFVSRHLPLEQLNLFGPPSSISDLRHQSQGNHSHVMGLPTPNYPAPPALRINSLYWPTGAMRYSTFIGLVDDAQLDAILQVAESEASNLLPGQLVISDSNTIIPTSDFENEFHTDANGRTAISAEMHMLTPRKISGLAPWPGGDVPAYKRLWLLPLVDVRYFWQTMPTPSWLFSNVKVSGQSSSGLYDIEFVGTKRNTNWQNMIATGASAVVTGGVDGSSTTNELQVLNIATAGPSAEVSYFTLKFLTTPGSGSPSGPYQTTEPIPNDALPEEISEALGKLPALQVTWQTLFNNLESFLQLFDANSSVTTTFRMGASSTDTVPAAWGWPDRTELNRRHESIAAVLDACAQSVGRRVVRQINGEVRIQSPSWSKSYYDVNLTPNPVYHVVAGGESYEYEFGGTTEAPAGIVKSEGIATGPAVPESVDVVYRDLTRSARSGVLAAPGGAVGTWSSDAGLLVANLPAFGSERHRRIIGWRRVIHTPTLNNTGEIAVEDAYAAAAEVIAQSIYQWAAYVYDWDFVAVKEWQPTGHDDHITWTLGERMPDGTYRAETRAQSAPFNFGVSTMLIQIGTQCPWPERFLVGELKENLDKSFNAKDDPKTARAWLWLPGMELQGEDPRPLISKRRPGTITQRGNVGLKKEDYVLAHEWFCEKEVVVGGGESGGGGGGGLIRFQIISVDCDRRMAECVVTGVPCENPFDVEVGSTIEVWDKVGCFFDVDTIFLQDKQGYATYMALDEEESDSQYPYGYGEECIWEVVALCVSVSACGPME